MENYEGIVIFSIDYKEKSKIVYLYTPYGHDSVRANGGKELKNGLLGFTTTANVVKYIKSNSSFPSVVEYQVKESFYELSNSIEKAEALMKFIKIIKEIPQDADHKRIYPFVLKMLNELKNKDSNKALAIFLIKMTSIFGITPNFKACVKCNNTNIAKFSIFDGGALCLNCANEANLNEYNIWKEYYYSKKEIDEFSDTDFLKLLNDIYTYYNNFLGLKLK